MRAGQIAFRFDDSTELEKVWAGLPAPERAEVARIYARLMCKAAKVAPSALNPSQQSEKDDDHAR